MVEPVLRIRWMSPAARSRPRHRRGTPCWPGRDNDAVIVEDDYDAEFRYDREPVGTLQGLAPDRVALIGTVSKSLAPALRLGWIVCPPALTDKIAHIKRYDDRGSPVLDQPAPDIAEHPAVGHPP